MPTPDDAQIKRVFDEAIELTGPARTEFLGRACAGAPHVLARVEALLKQAEQDDLFLSGPTMGHGAGGSRSGSGSHSARDSVDDAAKPGTRIGPYKLLEPIGEGGFGVVYMAEQTEPVRRRVALKIIKLGMDTRAVVARFEQERQALAMMDHPNIAKVFDGGATDAGRPYFVMELVRGTPITTYCDQANLSIPDRLDLFVQVCRAVQHAHTKGIIHRDIKPGNILVSEQDGRPLCKVIDFGIAKATQHPLTDKTIFTEFRQLVGTPEYMSPEQAGGALDVDTRTDVYSLGVLLYELLAGVTPFDPKALRSAAYGEMQRIIREVEPPAPSTRLSRAHETLASIAATRRTEPNKLGSLIRGELDWIVMRALDKDRSRRYDSPGNLAADIERYRTGQPVLAAPPGAGYRLRKFIRRHRTGVAAAVVVAAALFMGMTGTAIGLVKARRAGAEARLQAHAAVENAARADREAEEARQSARETAAVNRLLTGMVEAANRGRNEGRADITVREVMDHASKELEEGRTATEPRVEALLAKTIGETYRELSLLDQSEKMLRLQVRRLKEIYGEKSVEYGGAVSDLGGLVKSRGRLDEAKSLYDEAKTVFSGLGDKAADELCSVRINDAALLATHDQWAAAEAELREVVADFERRGAATSPKTPTKYIVALSNLGAVLFQAQKLDEAEKTFNRAVGLRKGAPGSLTPDLQTDLHNLGALQFARGDSANAVKTMQEEVAVARRLYGDVHIEVADSLQSLAVALTRVDRYQEEIQAETEALAIYRKLLPPDHFEIAHVMYMLGGTQLSVGNYAEAESLLRTALDGLSRKLGPGHMDSLHAAYLLGLTLEHRGGDALVEAERVLHDAHSAAEEKLLDGSKYEWMRHALASLLASILVDQSAGQSAPAARVKLEEASRLGPPAAERLLQLAPKMGPKSRKEKVGAALERVVRLHQTWDKLDPSDQHKADIAAWQDRLAEFNNQYKAN